MRVVAGWRVFDGVRLGEADYGLRRSLDLLRDAKADPARRAVALCWLFHIVGDMHQPLHAGHRMDDRFPFTDRAGTIGWVRRAPDAAPETFHHFWDQAADRFGDDWTGADLIVEAVRTEPEVEPRPAKDFAAAFRAWVRESEELAADNAYQGVALDESRRAATAPVLPPDYVANARTIADRRLGQAGERLAVELATLFAAD